MMIFNPSLKNSVEQKQNFLSAAFSAPTIPVGIANEISLIQENYPRIVEKITRLWGSTELHNYLESIIFDQRGGRQGFAETVAVALFKVREVHEIMFQTTKKGDVWDVILTQLK